MSAALQQPALKVEMLPVSSIRPCAFNPRKNFKDVEELAANIKATGGIKVPLRVRPVEGDKLQRGYELVFGERRWRAAQVAELAEVPAIVEAMGDAQALELMLVELAQTSNVHPVEEAEAYLALHEKHKLSVEEIAVKVGKSESHVYGRMKLGKLAAPVREKALAGELPATHALAIARVSPALQEKAMAAVGPRYPGDTWRTFREAAEILKRDFMLGLAEAPWDLKDEALLPAAGSCTKCPKRSGNQPELFGDVRVAKDTCTDPACFKEKKEAHVALRVRAAQDAGKTVLSQAEVKRVIGKHGEVSSKEFVDLDEEQWFGDERTTLRKKLGKKAPEPTLAPTAQGLRELVRKEDVDQILDRKRGGEEQAERARRERESRKFEQDQGRRAAVAEATMGELVAKLESKQLGKAAWFVIANAAVADFCNYAPLPEEMVRRRLGHAPLKSDPERSTDEMVKKLPGMSAEQLCAFTVELLLMHGDEYHKLHRGEEGAIDELSRMLGVDKKKVADQVKHHLLAADDAHQQAERAKSKAKGVPEVVEAIKKLLPAKPKVKKKAAKKPAAKKAKKK